MSSKAVDGERNANETISFLLRPYQTFECLTLLEKPSQQPSTWLKNTTAQAILQRDAWIHLNLLDFLFGVERREDEFCFRQGNSQSPVFIVPLRKQPVPDYTDLLVDIVAQDVSRRRKLFCLLLESVSRQMRTNWSEVVSELNNISHSLTQVLDVNQLDVFMNRMEWNVMILSHWMNSIQPVIPESYGSDTQRGEGLDLC